MGILIAAGAFFFVDSSFGSTLWERAGEGLAFRRPCPEPGFRNLALVTQNVQWLLLIGISFVVLASYQVVRGYRRHPDRRDTSLRPPPASWSRLSERERFATRRRQRSLIIAGVHARDHRSSECCSRLVKGSPQRVCLRPGLLLDRSGVGVMLTPSVNVVQISVPNRALQGEISGLSRSDLQSGVLIGHHGCRHDLGFGLTTPDRSYALAMIVLAAGRDRRIGGSGSSSEERTHPDARPIASAAPGG